MSLISLVHKAICAIVFQIHTQNKAKYKLLKPRKHQSITSLEYATSQGQRVCVPQYLEPCSYLFNIALHSVRHLGSLVIFCSMPVDPIIITKTLSPMFDGP